MADELDNTKYLRNLAERLMHVPVKYDTDQGDVDRLLRMARELETAELPRDWWDPCTQL